MLVAGWACVLAVLAGAVTAGAMIGPVALPPGAILLEALGRLTTAGWHDMELMLPWAVVATVALMLHRRALDVLAVGDEEAASLGLPVDRIRMTVVVAASLATAAAPTPPGRGVPAGRLPPAYPPRPRSRTA